MRNQLKSRKSLKVTVFAFAVAALAVAGIPSAQAGGFGFSFGGAGMGQDRVVNAGRNMDGGGASVVAGFVRSFVGGAVAAQHPPVRDQKFYDNQWAALQAEDAKIHQNENANGYSAAIQHQHDCGYAARIRALIDEMKSNKTHYLGFHSENGDAAATSEQVSIDQWSGRLTEAEKACGAKLY